MQKKLKAKILSLALAMAMVITALPGTVLAAEISPKTDVMRECHSEHDKDCGYMATAEGAPCTHSCELCKPTEEPSLTPECTCTVKCTAGDAENDIEASITAECTVCSAENADFAKCKGEEATLLSVERTVAKRTTLLNLQDSSYILDKDGKQITASDGVFDVTDSEGWKFDSNTQTLTLNGANFETNGNPSIIMPRKASTKIVLVGESFISNSNTCAIDMANGTLTIEGDGTLTANTSEVCIAAYGGLIINGGTLNVTSSNNDAIYTGDQDVVISSGTITLDAANGNAIFTDGSIAISGGTISTNSKWCGFNAKGAGITISGGTIDAESSDDNAIFTTGTLEISGQANVTAKGYYCGLQAQGNMVISGGTINAESSDDTAIFAKGTLGINGNAAITATGGEYCALKSNGNMNIGTSTIEAMSPNDSAIYTAATLTISEDADITATAKFSGLQSDEDLFINNGTIIVDGDRNAIYSDAEVTIEGTADVTVTSTGTEDGYCALTSNGDMQINGGTVHAKAEKGNAIYSYGAFTAADGTDITTEAAWSGLYAIGDITLNGTLQATGNESTAVMTEGAITVGENATITASSATESGMFGTQGIATSGKIDAQGNGNAGIVSYGALQITGGTIHAKGGAAAIFVYVPQNGGEAAVSQIILGDLVEKNGGTISFTDWVNHNGGQKSWTSFIAEDDTRLNTNADGSMENALSEIWLAAPHTVTFDVNGGSGTNSTAKVYPENKVTAPETEPAKDGCHFSGWYLDGSSTAFDFENTAITEDVTLKAKLDAHTPNADDGDCTTAVTCSVCNEITTAAKTHDWNTSWTSDSGNHWHTCKNTGCAQLQEKAAHSFGNWIIDTSATETEKGEKHRNCSVCAYQETVEIPTTGVTPEKPTINVDGSSSHQISSGKDMTFTCSGKLEDLTGIYVDGKLVDDSNYTLKSGSTILTLKASYLDNLSVGEHTLKFQYKDNVSAQTTFTITAKSGATPVKPNSPQTGDSSNLAILFTLLLASGGALTVLCVRRKRTGRHYSK